MTEQVTRHRGRSRDENGEYTTEVPDALLTPLGIAPGAGSDFVERSRAGETTYFTLYFDLGTDITSTDELTVRGRRFTIVVNEWNDNGCGGLEVLCNGGQG